MKFPVCDVLLAFKNGNAVVEKTLVFKQGTTKMRTIMPSTSIHGTFWIAGDDVKIISSKSVTSKVVSEEKKSCISIGELVEANVGNSVLINDEVEHVVIKEVLKSGSSVSIVILKEKDGSDRYLPIHKVEHLRGKEGGVLKTSIDSVIEKREIEIEYESPKKDTEGKMYFVMKNFTWCPSYRLHLLTDKKRAVLRMQATILNDAENIFVKKFVCAAGAPRMKFQQVDDPFVSGNVISSFFNQTSSRRSYPVPRMQTNRILSNFAAPQQMQQLGGGSSSAPQLAEGGSNATDYYYYDFKDVAIERSQRIILPVFKLDMPFEEVYKVKLRKHEALDPLKVTHCVKVINSSDFIWTTGPCTITSDKQLFAGQDQICYTAKTVHSLVEIADALSISVKFEESVEVNRKKKSRIYGYDYFEASVGNNVEITNYQDKEIRIMCDYKFVGELSKSSVKQSNLTTELNTSVESHVSSKIEYEINVGSNKTKKFSFTYKKWVKDRHY